MLKTTEKKQDPRNSKILDFVFLLLLPFTIISNITTTIVIFHSLIFDY